MPSTVHYKCYTGTPGLNNYVPEFPGQLKFCTLMVNYVCVCIYIYIYTHTHTHTHTHTGEEVTGDSIRTHDEELFNLYSLN